MILDGHTTCSRLRRSTLGVRPVRARDPDGWLYARWAVDDKGNSYLLKAARLLADEALPVNVHCVRREEEIGGTRSSLPRRGQARRRRLSSSTAACPVRTCLHSTWPCEASFTSTSA
jgi:hypothetical protein